MKPEAPSDSSNRAGVVHRLVLDVDDAVIDGKQYKRSARYLRALPIDYLKSSCSVSSTD